MSNKEKLEKFLGLNGENPVFKSEDDINKYSKNIDEKTKIFFKRLEQSRQQSLEESYFKVLK